MRRIKCEICKKLFCSFVGLGVHINRTHKTLSKEYYDRFLRRDNEGICLKCGKETHFNGLGTGYRKTCSYQCAFSRNEFRDKCQTMVKSIWKDKNSVFHSKQWRRKQSLKTKENWNNPDSKLNSKIRSEKLSKILTDNRKNPNSKYNSEEYKKKNRLSLLYAQSFIKNPSKPQVELYKLVKSLHEDAILNFQVYEVNRVIDIVIPSLMIAIEYDGSYWHQDEEKDKIRQRELEDLGWRFLRYRDYIPSLPELTNNLKEISRLK